MYLKADGTRVDRKEKEGHASSFAEEKQRSRGGGVGQD